MYEINWKKNMEKNRLKKDVCVCETETCGNNKLRHFEKCPTCGSGAYHKTIEVFEEVEGGKE